MWIYSWALLWPVIGYMLLIACAYFFINGDLATIRAKLIPGHYQDKVVWITGKTFLWKVLITSGKEIQKAWEREKKACNIQKVIDGNFWKTVHEISWLNSNATQVWRTVLDFSLCCQNKNCCVSRFCSEFWSKTIPKTIKPAKKSVFSFVCSALCERKYTH